MALPVMKPWPRTREKPHAGVNQPWVLGLDTQLVATGQGDFTLSIVQAQALPKHHDHSIAYPSVACGDSSELPSAMASLQANLPAACHRTPSAVWLVLDPLVDEAATVPEGLTPEEVRLLLLGDLEQRYFFQAETPGFAVWQLPNAAKSTKTVTWVSALPASLAQCLDNALRQANIVSLNTPIVWVPRSWLLSQWAHQFNHSVAMATPSRLYYANAARMISQANSSDAAQWPAFLKDYPADVTITSLQAWADVWATQVVPKASPPQLAVAGSTMDMPVETSGWLQRGMALLPLWVALLLAAALFGGVLNARLAAWQQRTASPLPVRQLQVVQANQADLVSLHWGLTGWQAVVNATTAEDARRWAATTLGLPNAAVKPLAHKPTYWQIVAVPQTP